MADAQPSRAEEAVRMLAGAAAATRLYPVASALPGQAVARAVRALAALTSDGSLRLAVEPKCFKLGDEALGENHPQVVVLAESLYAHQVGQLIVAPGLTEDEVVSFLGCVESDPGPIRAAGGIRSALVAAGVTHVAVIELTLRTTTDTDLVSIDVVSAPLEVVGSAVVRAAADWVRSGATGDGRDLVTEAIDGLESATRELAAARIAEALAQLDERTRTAVLTAALRPDASGHDLTGLLDTVARMQPAALARMLRLSAARTGGDPTALVQRLPLGDAEKHALRLVLRPDPRSEADSGVPATIDPHTMAGDAVDEDEAARGRLDAEVGSAMGEVAARALGTAIKLARRRLDPGTVAALGDALAPALADGAFAGTSTALELLAGAALDPELEDAARAARRAIGEPRILATAAARITTHEQAGHAAAVFAQAGPTGTDALLTARRTATPESTDALDGLLLADPERLLPAAGRRLRSTDPDEATGLLALLARCGDRRTASSIAQGLDNPALDVRAAALDTIAALDAPDVARVLVGALHRPDDDIARAAVRAIAVRRDAVAVPDLLEELAARPPKSWEYRREVVDCLKALRAEEALPALTREARRRFAFSRARRSLRQAARDALDAIRSQDAPTATDDRRGRT